MTATTLPAQGGLHDAPLGLLGPDGTLRERPGLDLVVTGELCRPLYRDMVLARRLDQEARGGLRAEVGGRSGMRLRVTTAGVILVA